VKEVIIFIYFFILFVLTLYAFHRYILVYLFQKYKNKNFKPKEEFRTLPFITIQLPIYNEIYVVERLLNAVSKLIYPKDKLQIQILDDSTDETSILLDRLKEDLIRKGFDVEYLHRNNRAGYKAGALQEGLKSAKGEFIAIFDADFVPSADFLMKLIHYFTDPKVAVVQARWGHINSDYSLLTKIQSIMLNGHFVVEHIARNRSGRFLNFNGTAGIWRKESIINSGGWHSNTLTEDLDLSYRAQMLGWKFIYVPEVVCNAELPVEIDAFKVQQYRWAKGSIQTTKKLLIPFLKSDLPWWIKIEGFFHLTANISYSLMLCLSILMFPSMLLRFNLGWYNMIFLDLPIFCLATFSIGIFYIYSEKEINPDWEKSLKYLPALMGLGYGLCINNAKAVIEGLLNKESEFVRTPKYSIKDNKDKPLGRKYRSRSRFKNSWELFFGLYYAYTIYFCFDYDLIIAIPFLLMFAFGFLYISLYSLWQKKDYWFVNLIKTVIQNP